MVSVIRHNLSPESAPWANHIEDRVRRLERQTAPASGISAAEFREMAQASLGAPQIYSHKAMLTAPTEAKAYEWSTPVPPGAKTAFVTIPFPSDYAADDDTASGNVWWLFVGEPEFDKGGLIDYRSYPTSLGQLFLLENPWELASDRAQWGVPVDVTGQNFFDITAWSFFPGSPTSQVVLQVDFVYVVFWSFEGVAQWGA